MANDSGICSARHQLERRKLENCTAASYCARTTEQLYPNAMRNRSLTSGNISRRPCKTCREHTGERCMKMLAIFLVQSKAAGLFCCWEPKTPLH